ncbi:hypothetical protein CEXT_726341 [Caerostris extrusa]|uniref:Uncharacterized protein n=1 Tax=Caerostris extrusa TaxID=172846 RepID=A0AAV4XMC8_CAEEX|nr:hypothetical protein CEXT_726341 [Caerostris extrusa]
MDLDSKTCQVSCISLFPPNSAANHYQGATGDCRPHRPVFVQGDLPHIHQGAQRRMLRLCTPPAVLKAVANLNAFNDQNYDSPISPVPPPVIPSSSVSASKF